MTDYPRECDPPQLGEGVTHVVVNPDDSETRTTDGVSVEIEAGTWERFRRQLGNKADLVVALESWLDWVRGHNESEPDPLLAMIEETQPNVRRPRQCAMCCYSPEVEGERQHPWHADDCPILLTVNALGSTFRGEELA